MEIFNAVSKQMDAATTVPKQQTVETRQVENTELQQQAAKESAAKEVENKEEMQKQLEESVKRLNDQMDSLKTNIQFGFNDKITSMYVDVMEKSSGKLIRKLPTEEAMKLQEHFKEINGIIFDEKG